MTYNSKGMVTSVNDAGSVWSLTPAVAQGLVTNPAAHAATLQGAGRYTDANSNVATYLLDTFGRMSPFPKCLSL